MTNKEKIVAALNKLGVLCDDCLSSASMVRPRQQVNILCRGLENEEVSVRRTDVCPRCGSTKIVNQLTSAAPKSLNSIKFQVDEKQRLPEKKLRPAHNHDLDALSEDEIKEVLVEWLEKDGWKSKVAWGRTQGIDVDAEKGKNRWIIEVKGPGSRPQMRVNYFIAILGETLQRMNDSSAQYSIALPDLQQYRRLWDRLPVLAKSRTGISILFVSVDGEVIHVNDCKN